MRVSNVLGMLLCNPGWIRVCVSCRSDVIELVFVVLFCRCVAVAIFPMMTQAADPALAVKRVMKDRSCESEGNMLHLCWNMYNYLFC